MATMRLRCIHSCMVLTVVGLLLIYSAFLTSPSYVDTNSIDGETTGIGGTGTASALAVGQNSSIILAKVNGTTTASAGAGNSRSGTKENPPSRQIHSKSNQAPLTASASSSSAGGKPTTPTRIPGTVLTRDIYEPGFLYPNPGVCPNDGQDTRLLILIASAPNHFSARDAIRLTWGHFAQRLDVNYAFIIGKTEHEPTLDGIETEKHLYDDLIVANFEDSYDNLTLKTMSSMEWIDSYCNQSDFVLKTDDDMFINVPNLLSFIDKIEDEDKKEPKLYGRLARKWKPVRNKKSKYYISFQQYKKTIYPDFTTGPAYLFRARLARPLFDKGMQKTYLKLEDVYTTGIVAQELKIKRVNVVDFANKKVNLHKTGYCALSKLISLHMVAYHEQFELWKKMLDGRTKCKIVHSSKNNTTAATSNGGASASNTNNSDKSTNNNSHSNKDSRSSSHSNNSNNNINSAKDNKAAPAGAPTTKLLPTTNSTKKKK